MSVEHRQLGVDLFNDVWRLIESRADDDMMVNAAHASAYHWSQAPECEPKNRARSEWQLCRVYSVVGRGEPALHHAGRCLAITEEAAENMDDFDLPFAYEALARANAVAGQDAEARRYEGLARSAGAGIADDEDREHFEAALATLP